MTLRENQNSEEGLHQLSRLPAVVHTAATMFAEAKRRLDSGDKAGAVRKLESIRDFCKDDVLFLTEAVEGGLGVLAERLLGQANTPKVPRFAQTPVDLHAAPLRARSKGGTFAAAVRF